MLQRAASNAYSWWWASHIRTKQSKWLEQNLQDMEDKVQSTLKLISEDGDSFAKRAEMYYKRRPELINFVEESYRAYRSLAERYDHISTELQNANNALATYFPDQVQFAMDDGDDDEDSPRKRNVPPPSSSSHLPKPSAPIPKVPKAPLKDLKSILSSGAKKLRPKKDAKASPAAATFSKSGLTKPEGLERIDKLQKDILELQTVKEFVKSSYEGGVAKYWEIEDQITGMQADVSALQDEFNETVVIEDDEARSLMTATALKSCQETLAELQEKQGKSVEAAKVEQMRIKEVRDKFYTLKKEIFLPPNESSSTEKEKSSELRDTDEEEEVVAVLEEKIKEHFQVESSSSSSSSLTVTEMTEKIDELVNKVISLETAVSSQDALIARLKSETNHLQWQIQVLEKDRAKGGGSEQNMRNKMEEMEHSLHEVEDLTLDVKKKNINLHTHFAEAKCNLQLLYEVHCVKSDDEQEEETASLPKSSRTEDLDKDTPQGEPIKAASSSRKPRAESGLISGAKKLMGFKVQEDTTGKQKRANQDKEKQEEEEPLPNVVSSDSSSSVKVNQPPPRAESGLLTEAKKLMGFKLLEDSATDPPYTNEQQKVSNSTVEKKLEQQTEAATLSSSSDEEVGEKKIETGTTQTQSTSTSSEEQNNAQNTPPKEAADVSVQDITSDKSSAAKEIEIEPQQQQNDEANKEETEMVNSCVQTEPPEKQEANQDEPNWRELFLQGMEVREKTLLNEYTATLRNYKDLKKKLNEVEKKKSEVGQAETIIEQLRALKTANAMKDEEIRALHEKLDHLQTVLGQNKEEKKLIIVRESFRVQSRTDAEFEDEIKVMMAADIDEEPVSEVEEKLRMDIDQVLEVNLDFWLRFSESLNQIKKYETAVEDLRREISKLEEKASKQQEGSSKNKEGSSHRSKTLNLKSDMKPIYKHLREIQTELAVWNDKCLLLKEEQQSRFTSLCDIQEEITKAVKASAEDEDFTFTSYQAAKFQGEVLNMKQENNKVANELQAGLDHITVLQIDVDRTLVRLNQEYEFSGGGSNSHQAGNLTQSPSRARVPLRSFIFGVKQKKRPSIFTCMTPAMHRKYNGLRVGF